MRKEITLTVAQGVGDIFWCIQKFHRHVEKINLRICRMPTDESGMKLQARAEPFLRLIPKVGDIEFVTVTSKNYIDFISRRYDVGQILGGGNIAFDYCVNHPLEDGVRLEEIDPDFPVEWELPISDAYCPLPFNDYVCLFVSGSFNWPGCWTHEKWADLVAKVYKNNGWTFPIILVGAYYDKVAVTETENLLRARGIKTQAYIDSWAGNVAYIIRNSRFFIGFQSGLSILADIMDVPQLMLYLPLPDHYLAPSNPGRRLLMYTWAKKRNIMEGVYNADTFDRSPEDVADRLGVKKLTASSWRAALLTCGVGDFIALDGVLTKEERRSINMIHYATRAQTPVSQLVRVPGVFPNLRYTATIYNKFASQEDQKVPFCIDAKEKLSTLPLNYGPIDLRLIDDYGVKKLGEEFFAGERQYRGSTFAERKLADIDKFKLPEKYVAIHSHSENVRSDLRDFTGDEWRSVIAYLERENVLGVVVNAGNEKPPKHARLLDLTNKTTLEEALEIVKGCTVFVGCSSVFSVMAAKVLAADRLVVKGHKLLRDKWAPFYYAPHKDAGQFVFLNLDFLRGYGPKII